MIRLRITTLVISLEILNQDVCCRKKKSDFFEAFGPKGLHNQMSQILYLPTSDLVNSTRRYNRAGGASFSV